MMTPEQKIKWAILVQAIACNDVPAIDEITAENIDDLYHTHLIAKDYQSEFRTTGELTGLQCDYSRHYESDAVAAQVPDGSWVGWTYWHGGGKHSDPEAIDWMDKAYFLDCTEEEKMVVVRTFAKADEVTTVG